MNNKSAKSAQIRDLTTLNCSDPVRRQAGEHAYISFDSSGSWINKAPMHAEGGLMQSFACCLEAPHLENINSSIITRGPRSPSPEEQGPVGVAVSVMCGELQDGHLAAKG